MAFYDKRHKCQAVLVGWPSRPSCHGQTAWRLHLADMLELSGRGDYRILVTLADKHGD